MIRIDLHNMCETLNHIEQLLKKLNKQIEAPVLYKANFVCEEILTNLARHADFEKTNPNVSMTMHVSNMQELILTFKDNSHPFNILDFPDPILGGELEDTELGGLGIFLTKQYAKDINYDYKNDYNILKVTL